MLHHHHIEVNQLADHAAAADKQMAAFRCWTMHKRPLVIATYATAYHAPSRSLALGVVRDARTEATARQSVSAVAGCRDLHQPTTTCPPHGPTVGGSLGHPCRSNDARIFHSVACVFISASDYQNRTRQACTGCHRFLGACALHSYHYTNHRCDVIRTKGKGR